MTVAFFDMDLTLLDVNSAKLWVKREVQLGNITKTQAVKSLGWIAAYHMGFVRLNEVMEDAMESIKGMHASEMVSRTDAFWEEEIKQRFRPGALKKVAWHKDQGHRVVMLTSSMNYLAERVAAHLGMEGYLCTHFGVDRRGCLNGKADGGFCFGDGKVKKSQAYVQAHGISLKDCYFYTDSMSDLPAMEVMGHPVAVHPDPRLRKVAEENGWPIEVWEKSLFQQALEAEVEAKKQKEKKDKEMKKAKKQAAKKKAKTTKKTKTSKSKS